LLLLRHLPRHWWCHMLQDPTPMVALNVQGSVGGSVPTKSPPTPDIMNKSTNRGGRLISVIISGASRHAFQTNTRATKATGGRRGRGGGGGWQVVQPDCKMRTLFALRTRAVPAPTYDIPMERPAL
jgi:hypothetical protein